jgi:hypothetical protein
MTAVYNKYSGTGYGGLLTISSPDSRFASEGGANQTQLYTGAVFDATATDARTAPWQELSDVSATLVGGGHVSGLLMRQMWPLTLMLCADQHRHSLGAALA